MSDACRFFGERRGVNHSNTGAMANKQLFVGLAVEGTTDVRFLESIVCRSFEKVVKLKSDQEIDVAVYPVHETKVGRKFPEFVAASSKAGVEKYGILVLAVHADSDKDTLQERMKDKFIPAINHLNGLEGDNYCRVITPIIPMRMIEAWMMADKVLLKEEIGTEKSDSDLGIQRKPETIADPKAVIENAIAIAQQDFPKKRRTLSIGDLYGIMGEKISLEALSRLSSYQAFYAAVEESVRQLHYIQ